MVWTGVGGEDRAGGGVWCRATLDPGIFGATSFAMRLLLR